MPFVKHDTQAESGVSMRPNYNRVNEAARELHRRYRLVRPPFDPEVIAEAEGYDVVYADFDALTSPHISGYSDANNRSIVVNRAISPARKIYTIAHELAHLILHRDYVHDDGRYKVLPRRNFYNENDKPVEEKEADAFAAEFLVPLKVLRDYDNIASETELAKMFAVSSEVIANRRKWL